MIYLQTLIILFVAAGAVWAAFRAKRRPRGTTGAPPREVENAEDKLVFVYVAGSEGLKRLHKRLGGQDGWWKVGVAGARGGDPHELLAYRMRMLKGYGAFVRTEAGLVEEPGFDEWRLQPLARPSTVDLRQEIRVMPNHIEVRLPSSLSFGTFDAKLRNALRDRSLHHCLGVGTADCGTRFTQVKERHVLQTEIVRLRPHLSRDIEHLLAVIGAIIDENACRKSDLQGRTHCRSGLAVAEPRILPSAASARARWRDASKMPRRKTRGAR